jgi:CRISPR-associated protein Cmr6
MNYPIPRDSAEAFGDSKNWPNAGLIFDRFAPDTQQRSYSSKGATPKKEGLERVVSARRDPELRIAALQRWRVMVQAAGATPFTLRTEWRFVSGVGRNTPFEVGFRFDRYGFAAFPGSGVKGIARAYAYVVGEENSPAFLEIFGSAPTGKDDEQAGRAGRAIFFDAMPADDPKLVLDVINPHYPDYYAEKAPPTNWQSPVPIYFLTVAAGVAFEFAIGWRGERDETLQAKAREWLAGGLTELGAGAKTNAGYGYFTGDGVKALTINQPATIAQTVLVPKTEPQGELRKGQGRLRREGQQRVWIQDGDQKIFLKREFLGDVFNSLPGDKTEVAYEYDEVTGERRVWKVKKKMDVTGLSAKKGI